MNDEIINSIRQLEKKTYTNTALIPEFIDKLETFPSFTQSHNQYEHLCSFFIPYHKESKSMYLILHRKSGLWMPPGGHMEENETPMDTIKRECKEELDYTIKNERITLFDISITRIENPTKQICRKHYDMWHIIYMNYLPDFTIKRDELLDGKWCNEIETMEKITLKHYKEGAEKVFKYA